MKPPNKASEQFYFIKKIELAAELSPPALFDWEDLTTQFHCHIHNCNILQTLASNKIYIYVYT
jgi:hypothetical protein